MAAAAAAAGWRDAALLRALGPVLGFAVAARSGGRTGVSCSNAWLRRGVRVRAKVRVSVSVRDESQCEREG